MNMIECHWHESYAHATGLVKVIVEMGSDVAVLKCQGIVHKWMVQPHEQYIGGAWCGLKMSDPNPTNLGLDKTSKKVWFAADSNGLLWDTATEPTNI